MTFLFKLSSNISSCLIKSFPRRQSNKIPFNPISTIDKATACIRVSVRFRSVFHVLERSRRAKMIR
ncbi:hypothetical protein BofuT4_uP093490.1 [Botrytis cinerea T4]|uniref:Uncharacterized protein n=1 Tax=Botryotinia fuckeliana (strain T4) TaxID=999810 RepID=G2YE79_BOTF4|nr:hypothetical protein BofuT4_uP093490.1 [Botrytis cinerea T4]